MIDPAVARELVAAIASAPRPAGGSAERAVRERCASMLGGLGFTVTEQPFTYSAFPGRFATPAGGACALLLMVGAGLAGGRGNGAAALVLLLAGAAIVGAGARWMAHRGVLYLPWMRRPGTNLVARRGEPRVWLVAHLDSKSQPVPIGVRAAGILASLLLWGAGVALSVAQMLGSDVAGWWPYVSGAGALAALPVIASVVGERSPGALDNASGVATVLLAARGLPRELEAGVLLTSAEELGLAGARVWASAQGTERGTEGAPRAMRAINVDGVDDDGMLRLVYTRARPSRLLEALHGAARRVGTEARSAALVPGVLVDGVALADAGWEVVTVSKGTLRTVARIHTPRDSATHISGRGIAEAASMIASAIPELD